MTGRSVGGQGHDLPACSAVAIRDAIAGRAVSCVEIVEANSARVEAVNGALKVVVAMALDQALR